MEAEPGSDQQGPQRWSAQVDLGEHAGGYGEQGSKQRYLVVLGGLLSGAAPPTAKLQGCLPGDLDAGAEPTDALGIEPLGHGSFGDSDGQPVRSNAVNQGCGNDSEQGGWRKAGTMQRSHGAAAVGGLFGNCLLPPNAPSHHLFSIRPARGRPGLRRSAAPASRPPGSAAGPPSGCRLASCRALRWRSPRAQTQPARLADGETRR